MSESKPQQDPGQMVKRYMFTGLGVAFGAGIGYFIFKNFELGAGIGLVLGAIIDGLLYKKRISKE
jgi:hypothetical protein